jgi:hypothetical protein
MALPRNIQTIDKMPLLGTGKIDYVTLQTFIKNELSE